MTTRFEIFCRRQLLEQVYHERRRRASVSIVSELKNNILASHITEIFQACKQDKTFVLKYFRLRVEGRKKNNRGVRKAVNSIIAQTINLS